MNLSCALVFLFVINIASGYTSCRDWPRWHQNEDQSRNIIDGVPIKAVGDFPYLVSLRYRSGEHMCGGSILNERYILTAAHCIEDSPPVSIQYGKVKIDPRPRGPNVVQIKRAIVHENYNHTGLQNDIALIELEEDINFGKHANPVRLPYQNEVVPESNNMLIMGWGITDHGTDPLHGLYTNVTRFPDAYCSERIPFLNLRIQYCGGKIGGGRAACIGDSGGPVMINGKQYGIVSGRILECGNFFFPEYYTQVPAYRTWIKQQIGV